MSANRRLIPGDFRHALLSAPGAGVLAAVTLTGTLVFVGTAAAEPMIDAGEPAAVARTTIIDIGEPTSIDLEFDTVIEIGEATSVERVAETAAAAPVAATVAAPVEVAMDPATTEAPAPPTSVDAPAPAPAPDPAISTTRAGGLAAGLTLAAFVPGPFGVLVGFLHLGEDSAP